MRTLLSLVLALLLVTACSKKEEKKAEEPKKKAPSGDLIEEVSKEPTYSEQGLRVLRGAKDVKEQIDEQTRENQKLLKEQE